MIEKDNYFEICFSPSNTFEYTFNYTNVTTLSGDIIRLILHYTAFDVIYHCGLNAVRISRG